MNEELQKKFEGYLDALESTAGTAGEFVAEQAPLYVQEYLSWYYASHAYSAIISAGLFLTTILLAHYLLRWGIRLNKSPSDELSPFLCGVGTSLAIASTFAFGAAIGNGYHLIKVSIAPRVVIVEELRDMIKGIDRN